jgi:methylmalonyl-CoA mutase N-terminal domain/subunit
MEGSFDGAVIVMMGCKGIKKCAATAFIEKGASAYVGWDGLISAGHTDRATINFLKKLLSQKQTIAQAVTETMTDVGYDPRHNSSSFLFWPIKAGHHTVPMSKASKSAAPAFSG